MTSDAHRGLKGAIEAVLQGASWQRCRVLHSMLHARNALSLVPKAAQQMVGATMRTVFAQHDARGAREQFSAGSPRGLPFPLREARRADGDEAEEEVLSYATFPAEPWQKIWSNNPLERVNKEVKRRTEVAGIFPNEPAIVRLVGAGLSEQHDEWQVGKRYFRAGTLAKLERKEGIAGQPGLVAG